GSLDLPCPGRRVCAIRSSGENNQRLWGQVVQRTTASYALDTAFRVRVFGGTRGVGAMVRLAEAIASAVAGEAERDPRVWVLDGDLADSYGVDAIAARLDDRYIQCGIAEQAMVSLAAGLAAVGVRPWAFSFA